MADVQDTLTTVFRVVGFSQLATTFGQAGRLAEQFAGGQVAMAAAQVAAAEKAAATAAAQQILAVSLAASASTASEMKLAMLALQAAEDAGIVAADGLAAANTALAAAELAVLGPIALIVAAIVTMTAAIAGAIKALHTFGEEQQKLLSAQVVFRNLGVDAGALRGTVDQISRRTTVQRPELLGAAEQFAEAGLKPEQITKALDVAANVAILKGKSVSQVAGDIENAVEGQTRAMRKYGITLQDTGSRAANFALIMRQFEFRFHDAAEAFKLTLPGAIANLQNSMQHLFSVIGERLAPAAVKVLNMLASVVDFIADHIDTVIALVNPLLSAMLSLMGQGQKNPMAAVGAGDEPATEGTAQQIADNTKRLADSVEQQVLGGAGEIARQAFGHMQARMALAI